MSFFIHPLAAWGCLPYVGQDAADKRSYQFHLKVVNVKLRRSGSACARWNLQKGLTFGSSNSIYEPCFERRQAVFKCICLTDLFWWANLEVPNKNFPSNCCFCFPLHGGNVGHLDHLAGRLKVLGASLCAYGWFSQMERWRFSGLFWEAGES